MGRWGDSRGHRNNMEGKACDMGQREQQRKRVRPPRCREAHSNPTAQKRPRPGDGSRGQWVACQHPRVPHNAKGITEGNGDWGGGRGGQRGSRWGRVKARQLCGTGKRAGRVRQDKHPSALRVPMECVWRREEGGRRGHHTQPRTRNDGHAQRVRVWYGSSG